MKFPTIRAQTRNSGKKLWNLLQALLSDHHKLQNNTFSKLLTATFLRTFFITHALTL